MQITETGIQDLVVIEPRVFTDSRGYFFESYNEKTWSTVSNQRPFVQDNEAFSTKGVLRGLHYQIPPFAQAKLVRAVLGELLDVVVDIRPDSPTYGHHFSILLSAENKKQLYVPRGFAHGYVVLSETAIFAYKCDNYYSKNHEGGIIYNDPQININWGIDEAYLSLSDKDQSLPVLGNHRPFEIEKL